MPTFPFPGSPRKIAPKKTRKKSEGPGSHATPVQRPNVTQVGFGFHAQPTQGRSFQNRGVFLPRTFCKKIGDPGKRNPSLRGGRSFFHRRWQQDPPCFEEEKKRASPGPYFLLRPVPTASHFFGGVVLSPPLRELRSFTTRGACFFPQVATRQRAQGLPIYMASSKCLTTWSLHDPLKMGP